MQAAGRVWFHWSHDGNWPGRPSVVGDRNKRYFRGGEDDTNFIGWRTGSTIRIATDHAGNMPVFFDQDDRIEAASNSVSGLDEDVAKPMSRYVQIPQK